MKRMKRLSLSLIICWSISTTLVAQSPASFPDHLEKLYMQEKYQDMIGSGLGYLLYLDEQDQRHPEQLIRMAYFLTWSDVLKSHRDSLIDLWMHETQHPAAQTDHTEIKVADYQAILAVMASEKTNYKKAIRHIKQSLEVRQLRATIDSAIQADGHQFLANLYKKQMDYSSSREHFTEAIRLNTRLQRQKALAGIALEQADTYLQTEPDNPQIIQELLKALDFFRQEGNVEKQAFAFNEIGNVWAVQHEYAEAIKWFRASVDLMIRLGDKNIDHAFNNLSAMYNFSDKPDSVIYYMTRAIESTQADQIERKALYYSNMGAIYGGLNQPDSALQYFTAAIQTLYPEERANDIHFNPDPPNFVRILPTVLANKANALFELYKNTDSPHYLSPALKSIEVAVNQFNKLRSSSSTDNKILFGMKSRDYYFLALEIALENYQLHSNDTNFNLLLHYSQQAKTAVFNEYQRILLARDSLQMNPTLIQQDDSLKNRQAVLNQQLFLAQRKTDLPNDSLQNINLEILQVKKELEALTNEIVQAYPVYASYIAPPPAVDLKMVRRNLENTEVIIDYTLADSTLIIIGIDHNKQFAVSQILPGKFQKNSQAYLRLLNQETGSKFSLFTHLSHEFWKTLIQPVETLTTKKDLVIIPDGMIGYLPFDTFITDSTEPDRMHYNALNFLIKNHSIRYLTSLQQAKKAERRKNKEKRTVLAFAPFTSTPYDQGNYHLAKLTGSRLEVEGITHHAKVKTYFDQSATKDAFLDCISSRDIIHLATHGLLSSGNPMNNRILFHQQSGSSNLPLFEVINLPVHSSLVVLSACETGTGDLREGEGIMSLTRGFHNAGTPSLIMSLWPAYDTPSVKIMEVFYRELGQGKNLAKAIQEAKIEYLREANMASSHPGYWANYQLSGLNAEIQLHKPVRKHLKYLIPIGFVLGLFLLLLWFKKKSR